MSIQDRDKQKAALEKTLQKFTELLPSVSPVPTPVKKALVIINGTAKSRTAVLLAEELNRNFGTGIDVVCFYSEQKQEIDDSTKESYENTLAFAYEHLRSKEFEIKGHVVENIDMLKNILNNVIQATEYDIIIVPSSFIGMKKVRILTDEEDTEASITVLGDVFEYLLEDIEDIPLLLVQSERVNLELLWKSICVLFSSSSQISLLFQKALKYSLKKADIHCFLNIEPNFHEEKSEDEFTDYVNKSREEIERFERANSEVFKEASRYVEFHYLINQELEVLKDELATCGKDVGILIIYMPSKHYRLYGLFTELLEDPEISFPILITRRKISTVKEEKEKEMEEETSQKEIEEEILDDEKEEEETITIDDTIKETIKEEVKKDILGKSETKEEKEKEMEEKVSKEEEKEKEVEEMGEPDKKDEEELSEIEELKEEVKEEIKKEVKKEIKSEPKREVKKEVSKELKKEESMVELKETIINEIKEEIKEEIKYELRKDLKEPKKELKEKVIEEIKEKEEEEEELKKGESEEEEEEDEEVTSRMEFE
ncbi:MAG: hypothetical protein H7641_13100 [Candidatus Heimdallarchaeota archaeon]|nr:hypothetical protein [Candidatus Heimdallarchaeota archaeon]MCK4878499.1 hypothetical protein [Candidatus Heimdallarchaeota archaeon]